ncbi:fibronectin type III domain-containing protein [Flavihumibacter sp. R14]|nr:fibronectin type III domain-containing protein [Flavihumibacter soli]
MSELKAEVLAAGSQFVELQWNRIYNTHFKTVTYGIYVNDKKIVEGLNITNYSLINLGPGQEYSVRIVASTGEGKQTEQSLTVNTLPPAGSAANPILSREYKIHSYSDMAGPTALTRFSGGGHLIVRYLQHPSYFSNGGFKVIVFRTDKDGNIMWYRLLPTLAHELVSMPGICLALHSTEQEGIVFLGGYAFKISTSDGEILQEKDFREINEPYIQSLFYVSPQQLIIGTLRGSLLSINPQDLTVQWQRINSTQRGEISGIKLDSKRNIFAIFRDLDQQTGITIHKYNSQGEYLAKYVFEGEAGTASFLVDAEDSFHLFSYSSYYHNLHYSKFNHQGTLIKSTTISEGIASPSPFFNDKNEVVVYGRYDGSGLTTYGGIFVFDKDLNVKSKRFYTEIPYHIFRAVTLNPDGSYNLFLNYMQTYTYENRNFVFIKTDVNGKI